jgi:hypothetical protein
MRLGRNADAGSTPAIPRAAGDRSSASPAADPSAGIPLSRRLERSSPEEIRASLTRAAAAFGWVNPGPVNIIGADQTRVSGKLQAFAWEPSHPQIMYAGGGLGSGNEGPFTETGAFKTTDGGATWSRINQGLSDTAVNVLWIDPSNPNLLLAGTEFGGIFRTGDAGQTWVQVSTDGPVSAFLTVSGGILAGAGRGFEFSTDHGLTWQLAGTTSSAVRCIAAAGSDMAAGLDRGDVLWKGPSDQSWHRVASDPAQLSVWDIAIDPVNSSTAYYISFRGSDKQLLRTTDRGVTSQTLNSPTGIYTQAIAVRPDHTLLVAGESMFYQSTDSGATWTALYAPWDSRRIFLIPNSSSLVARPNGHDFQRHPVWRGHSWQHDSHIFAGLRTVRIHGRRREVEPPSRALGRGWSSRHQSRKPGVLLRLHFRRLRYVGGRLRFVSVHPGTDVAELWPA